METSNVLHPFEKAGLGKAPFKFIGITHNVGPIKLANGSEVGAPGQPMGTCNYCSNGIAYEHHIRSADGKTFKVGCNCVEKIYNRSNMKASEKARDPIYQKVREHKNKLAREARHKREKLKIAEGRAWALDHEAELKATVDPHKPHWIEEDRSLWDRYEWYAANAGTSGYLKEIKYLKKMLEKPEKDPV